MITLPDYPSPAAADIGMVDFGAFLTPSLGGPVQRVERMGNRFRLSATMPPMKSDKLGRQWVSALIRGKQEGARIELPLGGFKPGTPGSPTVDGAGQAGRTLAITGATPNYVVRDGQWFNHVTATGERLLYMNVGETILDGSGDGTLDIEPMLRAEPGDGDAVDFGKPTIEGFIMGEEQMWSLALGNFIGIGFDLVEAK
jgi:hypothetical protein